MISVIITAYNVEDYISDSIKSVLEQTYKNVEIIVVCDKPLDNTEKIVDELAQKDDRIRVIKNEVNVGAGMARKLGIEAANGEFVTFLDGDDYFYGKTYLEELRMNAEETGADIVSGGVIIMREDGSWDATGYGNVVLEGIDKVCKFWGARTVYMVSRIIRRKLFEQHPYSPRRYVEDTLIIIPLLYLANKVSYINSVGYAYRMQNQSLTHTSDRVKNIIYKGLCWCDLMDFFAEHEPSILDICSQRGFIYNILKTLNSDSIDFDKIKPYINEYAELWARMNKIFSIESVSFKK